MSNQNKILVFTATYNEKDNIGELIYSITQNCSDADILIIDDNSPDKTYETIQEIQKQFKNIFLIKRQSKIPKIDFFRTLKNLFILAFK